MTGLIAVAFLPVLADGLRIHRAGLPKRAEFVILEEID
jgi:hypothetical protein